MTAAPPGLGVYEMQSRPQGLSPLAIDCRPSGASRLTSAGEAGSKRFLLAMRAKRALWLIATAPRSFELLG